ncbi:MAG: hypothetical protein ACRDBR_00370 [Metamycoplasmataceae bacterium]
MNFSSVIVPSSNNSFNIFNSSNILILLVEVLLVEFVYSAFWYSLFKVLIDSFII